MSLAEQWEETRKEISREWSSDDLPEHVSRIAKRAFYAGAQSALKETGDGTYFEIQAEIDHFRSHK